MARPSKRAFVPPAVPRFAGLSRVALAAIPVVAAIWTALLASHDPDTWWHLKTGELILASRAVPRADPFSFVIEGRPWVAFEWLAQVVFYSVHAFSSEWGLVALKASLSAAALLLFWALAGAEAWGAVLLFVTALINREFLVVRPQLFDYVLLGATLLLLDRREGRPGRLWFVLPAVATLWANVHGVVAGLVAAACGLRAALEFARSPREPGAAAEWAGLAAACSGALLLTPSGFDLFGHAWRTVNFPGREMINEWRAPALNGWNALFGAAGLLGVFGGARRHTHLRLTTLFFGLLALSANRHLFFFALCASAAAARALSARYPSGGPRAALCALLASAGIAAGLRYFYYDFESLRPGLLSRDQPEAAMRFLDDNGVDGRMFNEYNAGGWLIWRGFPRRKVFVDGRNVEYGPEFIARAVRWREPGILASLDAQYDFDYALLYNGPGYRARSFDESPAWALVFWDDAGLVYLKRGSGRDELIRRKSYRVLRPNEMTPAYLDGALRRPESARRALAELERAVSESSASVNARLTRAYALDRLGRGDESLRELEETAKLFPDKAGPLMSLGWWHEGRGRLKEAREAYERGVRAAARSRDPVSEAYLSNNLGAALLRLGDHAGAEAAFRRCLKLLPSHRQAASNLARMGLRY